jgi:hypothetical protein
LPHLKVKLGVVVLVVSLAAALFTPAAPAAASEAGHISGAVEDESGLPYPGTVVRLVDAAGAVVGRGTTDEKGRYGIDAPEGTYRLETETEAGDLQTRIEGVEVGTDSPLDVVVADGVRREVRFDGTMADTQGEPLAGATLKLENRTLSESASTDGAGHFDLTVPAGRYPLLVQLPGPGGAQLGLIQDFDLTRNRHEDFQIATAGVDVTVRNTFGQPVPNIGVGVAGGRGPNEENSEAVLHGATTGANFFAWVTSDGAGRAHLTGVVGATASVSAWSPTAQGNQPGISLGQSNTVDLSVVAVSPNPPDAGGQYREQEVASITTPDGYVHTQWRPPIYRASDGTETLKIEWTTGDTEWGDEGEEHVLSVVGFRGDLAPTKAKNTSCQSSASAVTWRRTHSTSASRRNRSSSGFPTRRETRSLEPWSQPTAPPPPTIPAANSSPADRSAATSTPATSPDPTEAPSCPCFRATLRPSTWIRRPTGGCPPT